MLGAGSASVQAGRGHQSRPDRRNGGLAAPIAWVGLLGLGQARSLVDGSDLRVWLSA